MPTGYVQLTPIPSSHLKNTNVLDRLTKAIDGPDPADQRKEWFEREKAAFLEWSGVADGDWRFTHVRKYLCSYWSYPPASSR